MTSNPSWGEKTSAMEAAGAFADRIRGRNGKSPAPAAEEKGTR